MHEVIDYTSEYRDPYSNGDVMAAHGRWKDFFVLIDLGDNRVKRADGKKGRYLLRDLSLSVVCEHSRDEAFACVQANDWSYWTGTEISAKMRKDLANGKKTLFDLFRGY